MIQKIKKQIAIIESASSDAVIEDAFECIESILDDAMESDAYVDLNIVKNCKSEVISNVVDFIDFEYSFAVLSDIANQDALIVDIPDNWNVIDVFAFADRINKNFALDIDWRQTSNYLWIKLDI